MGGLGGDPAFEEAQQAMERGDLDAAAAAFERVLAATPGHPVATLGLAQVDLIRRVSSYDEGEVRRAAAENPADVEAQARVADIEVATGQAGRRVRPAARHDPADGGGGPGHRPGAPGAPVRGVPAR